MLSFNFARWLKGWVRRPRGKTLVKRPRLRLILEELESRVTPAFVWQGGSGANWSIGANWGGGVAPTVGAPVDLVFSSTASSFNSNDDIGGLTVGQMTISANYTLTGSAGVTLNLGNPNTNTGLVIVNTGVVATSSIDLVLGNTVTSTEFFNVQNSGVLTWNGAISGFTTAQLTKQGPGTLILGADNSGFTGPFKIDNSLGNGVVSITNANALGSPTTSELQTFSITGASTSTKFKFTYLASSTPDLTFTGTIADQNTIQTALNALFNGLGFTGTPVGVKRIAGSASSGTFSIAFGGSMAGFNALTLSALVTAGPGTPAMAGVADGGNPNFTTVATNAQLQINITTGSHVIDNPLSLNGAGTNGISGALFNVAGDNEWAGPVQMNATTGTSNTTFGVASLGGTVTNASVASPIVITTPSTAGLTTGDIVAVTGVSGNTFANGTFAITVLSPTQFSLNNSAGNFPFLPSGALWSRAYTLTISGQISNAGLSGYTLTKEGTGTLYLNPQNAAGNTFAGNTIVNNGELALGHPFALGPGGARTIVNSTQVESGSLTLKYTDNLDAAGKNILDPAYPASPVIIPPQYLNLAQVQILTFANSTPGTTQFTLNYNGETTTPITYDNTAAGASAIQSALNLLPTIGGIGASVSVSLVGGVFQITFGGSLGGMEIPTISSTITTGPGTLAVGIIPGTTPIGFQVPNQFLTLNGPGKLGIFNSPRLGAQSAAPAPGAEVVGALGNQAGQNSWEQTVTFWSTPTSPLPIANYYAPAVTIGAKLNTNLTIDAQIVDNGVFFTTLYSFSKVGLGRVILTHANTFPVFDDVLQGALNIRDSNALGLDAGNSGGVEAWNGTSIELQADGIPDSIGTAGTYNLFFPPTVPIWLNGPGLNNQGALYSLAGSNKIEGPVHLRSGSSIGVAPDPDPLNIQGHTNNNLSQLTIDGTVDSLIPRTNTPLTKVGHGELVLTNDNTYTVTTIGRYPLVNTPQTTISQGWITAENNFALGGFISTTDAVNPPVSILPGAALHLKRDLNGNDLILPYNIIVRGTGIDHRFAWLNQKGALLNLSGTNTVAGYIYLEGDAALGVELDGALAPNPPVSEMILSGIGSSGATIMDGAVVGKLVKLGSQRLVVADPGTYTGGHDIREGVVRVENDTALGTGTPSTPVNTTINSGTALEIAPSVAQLNGGIERGLQITYNHLSLNGTGNTTFGDAPLVILSDDNIWRGPITLHSNVAVTFKNQLANTALPKMVVDNTAILGGGSISVNTTTPGSSGIAAVQTLTFNGTISGGTFTLTVSDGAATSAVTAPITWSANLPVLIANIQAALDALAPTFGGSVLAGIASVSRNSPIISVAPNSRFSITGVVDDSGGAADVSIAGGGELVLAGANTYQGTTNVNQGILTISSTSALGTGGVSESQTLSFTNTGIVFNLSFNGSAPSANITLTGAAADLTNISNELNALPTIGGVGGTATVLQAGTVFTVTLGGTLSGFDQQPITVNVVTGPGSASVATLADGAGGTIVAGGAQLQLQGGITISNEPLILRGQGKSPTAEIQSVTIAGGANGAFNVSFTNPNTSLTSFSTALPVGASALQVETALNQMASILQGSGAGGGSVKVTQSDSGVYSVQFNGTFVGATNLPTLGVNPVAEQVVAITGSSGNFTLNFTGTPGLTTVPMAPDVHASGGTTAAASIENALNLLLANPGTPGGGTGTAQVLATTTSGMFIITFGGSLANAAVPTLVAGNFTGNTFATVTSYNNATGFTGRVVAGGSSITIPTQWFQIGPAPINNGGTFFGGAPSDVAGRVSGILSDPNDPNIIYISTAGGGAWKTINAGKTWTPLFDGVSAVESVKITAKSGTFTLTFKNPLTGVTSTTPTLNYNASADQVESALNGLPSIGGAGGSVNVVSVPTGGVDEIQEIDLSAGPPVPGTTHFTVSYNGATTAPILYTGTSSDEVAIANALNSPSFSTIGGAGGVVLVSSPFTGVFDIRFGGTLAQQPQPFTFNVAITAGPPFTPAVTVLTPGALPFVTYGITFSGGTLRNLPLIATGTPSLTAIGSIGVVPSVTMVSNGLGTTSVMYSGAISIAPSDSRTLYLGTGETVNSGDAYYGTGVYVTHDYGQTWNLLVDSAGNNPLAGLAVSKIAVDPNNPNLIYVATADRAINSHAANGQPLVGAVGIWRFNPAAGGTWTNLTAAAFPTTITNFSFSDVALGRNGSRLFIAAGRNDQSAVSNAVNGVYVTTSNPSVGIPTWSTNLLNLGATLAGESNPLPGPPPNLPNPPRPGFGTIKITRIPGFQDDFLFAISTQEFTFNGTIQTDLNSIAYYDDIDPAAANQPTCTVIATTAAMVIPGNARYPTLSANIPDYLFPQGSYDTAIVAQSATTAYVGGVESGVLGAPNFVLKLSINAAHTNGGTTATDVSDLGGSGPHSDVQALSLDRNNNLLAGTDGGVWRLNAANTAWSDLNGNLAITEINGIATPSNNINAALIGAQDVGTSVYSGNLNWTQTDGGDGNSVLYDPNNPNVAYHEVNGQLRVSTNGGSTWTTVFNANNPFFAVAISSLQSAPNTSVLFIQDNSNAAFPDVYRYTYNYVTNTLTRLHLLTPIVFASSIAISTNQGPFQPDPDFPGVVDVGATNPDSSTVYITDGFDIFVTKNLGVTWNSVPRDFTLVGNTIITDLEVDPTNRDHIYAVTGGAAGGQGFTGTPGVGRVFESLDAGRTWKDVSAGLPDSPGWKLAIDSRNGDLYLGNDVGVYTLKGGELSGANQWTRFGAGLPYVAVHALDINPALNSLTAGSYGRSAFQFYLDTATVNSGALRAAAGSDIWNGPIILSGSTTISAQGNQEFHNGLAVAQLTILGGITDLTPNTTTNTLTKVGSGDVILSGASTYGGDTIVQQGNLVIQNSNALGSPLHGTTVLDGAVLQLSTSLSQEPLNLFGNGSQKSGHFTGALENVSNNNTYDGTITLQSNATIGVDSGSSLTIAAPGTITDGVNTFSLTKEGLGTLTLMSPSSYGGGTFVNVGVLNIQDSNALGSPGGTTTVLDGAQLQLQAPVGGSLNVATQNLVLTGSGIGGTGALYNVNGNNTWGSVGTTVTFSADQSFAPQSLPNGIVTLGVANALDTLTIGSPIGENGSQSQGTPFSPPGPVMPQSMALVKTGAGAVVLTQADTYSGTTFVNQGTLNIQNSNSLGLYAGHAIQRITMSDSLPTDTFTLTFKGVPTPALPIGETANNVQSALTNLSSIGVGGVHVGRSIIYSGINEVQTLTLTGGIPGTTQYKLTFNGLTTGPLTYTGTPAVDATTIANALDSITAVGNFTVTADPTSTIFAIHFGGTLQKALQPLIQATIFTTPGSVNVSEAIAGAGNPNYVYTVEFTGPLVTGPQPLIAVAGSSSLFTSTVTTVADGSAGAIVASGATLGLDGTGGAINVPAAETITLNGPGVNNLGALRNVSGNNSWNGPVTLATSSSIGADAGSLNITGNVGNPNPAPVPPASIVPPTLTKVGPGTVSFPNANTYTGNTIISGGILNIHDPHSLGFNQSAVQTVTVSGTSGSFTLFFSGITSSVSTGPINIVGLNASGLQSAINVMLANASAPGGGAGTVSVTQEASGNIFDVTFGGSLAGVIVPMLIAPAGNFTGSAQAQTNLIRGGGASETTVLAGGTLQMENAAGFTESSGKTIVLNGLGANGIGALDSKLGNNFWTMTPILLGSDGSIGADANRFIINQVISDQFQSQFLTFNSFVAGNAYNLSFAGLTTPTLFFNGTPSVNASAIQAALNALPTISLYGGTVTVTSLGGDQYRIDFTGPMAGAAWPLVSGTRITGAGSFAPVTSTMTNANFGVTKPGLGIVQYTGTAANAYTGLTTVTDGTLELNKTGTNTAILGNLTIGDNTAAVNETQTITLNGAVTTGTQFTLTFNAFTTPPIAFTDNAAAAVVAALTGPGGLGAGNVSVTQADNVFTITLINALGGSNQNQITGNIVAGPGTLVPATLADGAPATFLPFIANSDIVQLLQDNQIADAAIVTVKGDGLLDLNGHTEIIQDLSLLGGSATTGAVGGNLTINGAFTIIDGTLNASGAGALVSISNSLTMTGGAINLGNASSQFLLKATGTPVSATSSPLTGAAKITGPGTFDLRGVTETFTVADGPSGTDLFVNAILAGAANPGLIKAGAGRLEVAAQNTYPGDTRIDQGDIQVDTLNRQTVSLTSFNNGDTFTLTYSNGVQSGTTNNITYTGTPANDALSIQNALLTLLNLLNVTGGVTVTSLSASVFDILFNGNTALNNQPLRANVVSSGGSVKTAGVQAIGNVILNGSTPNSASISGKGAVGNITMQTTAATGTVTPGNNGSSVKTGTFQANGNVTWDSNSAFFVEVGNPSGTHPSPVVGSDYDQLYVNGNVTLGNAVLSGNVLGGGVQIGDQFTILKAASVSGKLDGIINGVRGQINDGGTVFLNGQKFVLNYFSDHVILTRQSASLTSLTFSSSANPSTYGQEVFITATAVAEPGASFATSQAKITFNLDGIFTQVVDMVPSGSFTSATAVFMPQFFSGQVWAPGSTHIITAAFADANSVFNTQTATASPPSVSPTLPTQLKQTVSQNTATITPSSTPPVTATAPVYGQQVVLTATLNPTVNANVPGASNPTGNVRFVVDPASASPLTFISPINYVSPVSSENATATLFGTLLLAPGSHLVNMTYLGDVNYAASTAPVVYNLFIQKDGTVVTFTPAPLPASLGQNATFFVTVTPAQAGSTGQPIGTLNFYDNLTTNAPLNSSPIVYSGGTASFSTNALNTGAHTIVAVFSPSNGNYTGAQGTTLFTVDKATTQTAITSFTPNPATFGEQITFNIAVSESPAINPIYGLPTGTVTLWDGPVGTGTNLGTGSINTAGQVSILTGVAGLSVGTHTINAVYSGDTTFATSTGTIATLVVQPGATTTTVTASPSGSALWGSTVRFTAHVTSLVGTPPTGSHVTFWDGPVGTGINLGTSTIDATGTTFVDVATLNAGTHTIHAVYTDDVSFNLATSTGTLSNYKVTNAPTTTTLATNPPVASGTGVYGQPITFQATVTSPGGTVNVGTVTFKDGATTIGTANVDASGLASLTINTLTATSHNLSAVFADNTSIFLTSAGTLSPYVINAVGTQILPADFTTSTPIAALGSPVTFTAKVTTVSPSTINVTAGTVTFWNGPVGTGTNLGSGTVNSSGVATITTSALPLGTLTINAVYSNGVNTNYLPSAPQSLTQIVRRATTMAFSPFVAPNNSFGAPLNYQVSVTPTTAAGTPTGTLTISEIVGSVTTPLASSGYAGGTISILVPTLSVGTHTLVLDYSGDATFAPNSKTITQTIVTTATTTTLDPVSPAFYGETVTFTATVTSPPAVDPTIGTVTFRDTYNGVTTTLATVTLSGTNVAQFTTTETQLKAGSHSIVAIYNNVGNPDYASSAPSAARIQVINKATTQTVLDPLSDSSFGNAVTFHATVSVTSPGSPGVLPGGTVTFRSTTIININSIPTPVTVVLGSATVNASGIATLTVSGTALAVTPPDHTITATYNGFAPNFAASAASAGLTQTINKADVNIGVTTSAASGTLTFGKAVTFTAVLSNASGGSPGAPLGTVQFWDGPVGSGTLLKSVTLVAINANSSKAVFVTTATQLSASSHDINVAYLGDAKHAATTQSLTYDMNQATTVTKLTSSPQFWPLNGVTTFIATVSANSGGTPGFPKGTVVFTIDGVPQAPVTLVNGKATKTFTFTTSTDHTVSADYLPVQNFADSSAAPQTQLVRKASTIGFTSVSTVTGVNVTATVTSGATGTVSFYENGVFLGSATIVNGVAKTSLVIGTGTHNITAVYSGDANFNPASITKAISGKLIGRLV